MFGAGIRLTARSLTRPGLLLSPRSSILQSFPLINQRWMSSTNSKSSKTAESAESSLFEPLKDAEDKNFLPFQIPTEVALDTDSTKPLPNTRGHFREV
jgi:hypothetical protein